MSNQFDSTFTYLLIQDFVWFAACGHKSKQIGRIGASKYSTLCFFSSGSGDFNPEQLDNPIYGTTGLYALDSEEAERSLENPVYGVSTSNTNNIDASEATYASVPQDHVVTYYADDSMETSYDMPMETDYYEIGSTDTPLSPLTPNNTDGVYNFVQ